MKSTQQKIEQLEGLLGTLDISEWEDDFITSLVTRLRESPSQAILLTDKQLNTLDKLYRGHFA